MSKRERDINFTFQYGSIQMDLLEYCRMERFDLYIPIWFYSNGFICLSITFLYTLHSNMVLFKYLFSNVSLETFLLYIPIWFYSNGLWQTWCNQWFVLYIPIWFYSNKDGVIVKLEIPSFTFQYGSIQIEPREMEKKRIPYFTFQYGSIQIEWERGNLLVK